MKIRRMSEHTDMLLRALPETDPPAGLWSRIANQRRRQRRRQQAGQLGAAVAMVAVLGLSVALLPRPQPLSADLGAWQQQSRQLEQQSGQRAADPAIQAIDRQLQAAYQRDATADELEQLWRMRNHYLRHAMLPMRSHTTLARI